jgi:hypothetical protein
MKRSVADPPAGVQRWGLRLCVGMMMLLHGVAAKFWLRAFANLRGDNFDIGQITPLARLA